MEGGGGAKAAATSAAGIVDEGAACGCAHRRAEPWWSRASEVQARVAAHQVKKRRVSAFDTIHSCCRKPVACTCRIVRTRATLKRHRHAMSHHAKVGCVKINHHPLAHAVRMKGGVNLAPVRRASFGPHDIV